MRIVSEWNIRDFQRFSADLYREEPGHIDNRSSLLALLCRPGTAFFERSCQEMVRVVEKEDVLCQTILMKHRLAEEVSVAFFDARPDCREAVDLLLGYAETFARKHQAVRIVVGLEGHCNHLVGIPIEPHPPVSFGESVGKAYYHDYFREFRQVRLRSYCQDKAVIKEKLEKDVRQVLGKFPALTFETPAFDRRGFARAMQTYTRLNNRVFSGHRYYYPRSEEEDLELFRSMKPLLKPENLIFAELNGEAVGYILWYPDFNELVKPGKTPGIDTFLRYKVLRQVPSVGKVVEIALEKKYERTGLIALLFWEALKSSHDRCDKVISSWVLEENLSSSLAVRRYANQTYKEFAAYEKDIILL